MARMGRPPKADTPVQWCFRLPSSLAERWDTILSDPINGRIPPNVKQELFIPLLDRLWAAAVEGRTALDVGDLVAIVQRKINPPTIEEIFNERKPAADQ